MAATFPLTDVSSTGVGALWDQQRCSLVAATLKALSDPVRLRLFTHLAARTEPVCVCHLPDVGVAQPTVSHHLSKLRDAGLIECERRGTWVYYWPTTFGRDVGQTLEGLARFTDTPPEASA